MARVRFNVPAYRPNPEARLSELPEDVPEDEEPGWAESSLALMNGLVVSELAGFDDAVDIPA